MSVQVRYRREAASFLASFVGAQGELLIDTTNNRVQVHDGATPGGFPAARLSEVVTNARTSVADANYTVQAGDRTIAITSLSTPRTLTLPAASTFPTGTQLVIFDETGACSASNTITIVRAGTDTINGAASATIATAYGYLALESNGAGRWTIVDSPAIGSGTPRTPVADASYTVVATDRLVGYTALTAARTVTLPAASTFQAGVLLVVVDESGACSPTNAITIARAGTDTINGAPSAVVSTSYGYLAFESNGAGKWTIVDQAVTASAVPKNNFAGTSDPSSSMDGTQGYAAGSLWLRTDTGDIWRCRSGGTGAAVWLRLDQADFHGYVAGNWYRGAALGTGAGTTIAASRPAFFPVNIKQRCTLSAMEVYIGTAAASGNLQIALYASDPVSKLPIGAPLATTASLSTAATGNVSAAVSQQLDPGLYWTSTMVDNTSAAIHSYANTAAYLASTIGFATEANASSSAQIAYILYGTGVTFGSWPSPTGSSSFTFGIGNAAYTPAVNFRVASIP